MRVLRPPVSTQPALPSVADFSKMVPSVQYTDRLLGYISGRLCFILMVFMPTLAAAADHVTTVVHADEKTGRLVRSIAVWPRVISPRTSAEIPEASVAQVASSDLTGMIDRIAEQHGVEGSLVHSVIQTESNYNPLAVSPKGALGLMQLIPSTAKRFGVADAFNVAENIQGGVRYLRFLLDYYQNDYVKAIAAYNAGEAAVDRYNGIPPYQETRGYVYAVARNLKTARAKQEAARIAAVPIAAENTGTIVAFTGADGKLYYRTRNLTP
jgi:soluble lytic murein transglycosylase-like protein